MALIHAGQSDGDREVASITMVSNFRIRRAQLRSADFVSHREHIAGMALKLSKESTWP